jgi:hypothetical protein
MPERMSAEEYRKLYLQKAQSKYKNLKASYDSPLWGTRIYDSKAEAQTAAELDRQVMAGLIRSWIPQVSFPVPKITERLRLDFVIIENDGKVRFADKKGVVTPQWQTKARAFEATVKVPVERFMTRQRAKRR